MCRPSWVAPDDGQRSRSKDCIQRQGVAADCSTSNTGPVERYAGPAHFARTRHVAIIHSETTDVLAMMEDRKATLDEVEAAAHSCGYAIASTVLPHVDARKGRFSNEEIGMVTDAIKSGLNKSFAVALRENILSVEELDAWSRGLHVGAQAALAHCFASYI